MLIGTPKETFPGENRVAMTPESVAALRKLGHSCVLEAGAGLAARFSDEAYIEAGATIMETQSLLYEQADIIAKLRPPSDEEVALLRKGQTLISFFYPGQNEDLMKQMTLIGATGVAMDMVPRISRAQKMDALSSMANIAGYRAVIEAGQHFGRFFTGQITAAGKVPPAKVLVIGAGVAGLAAIGAATSLGAEVYAFDVRPEVAEQIASMGAEFVHLEFEEAQEDGAKSGGYATPSSPEFREKQLEKFRELAPEMDIVITTALIPGRDAPKLWLSDMVLKQKAGSVIVDLAAERGGNCELTRLDEVVTSANGVTIVGYSDYPSRMATQASQLFATNIQHMIADMTPEKDGQIVHDMEDDVIRGATITRGGEVTYPPPPPKVQAIAAAKPKPEKPVPTAEERKRDERKNFRHQTIRQVVFLLILAVSVLSLGRIAPESFMQHFIVFVLSVFVGFQVIWNVSHSLHTPLMAVTNAISSIIILGALLQIGSANLIVVILGAVAIFVTGINIFGGFMVTRRMLAMFQKS